MYRITNYISIISNFVPAILSIAIFNRLENSRKLLVYFFSLMALIDFFMSVVWLHILRLGNNHPFMHLAGLIEACFISMFFYQVIQDVLLKKIILVSSILVCSFAIITAIFYEGIFNFPSISQSPVGIMIIIWVLLGFYQLINQPCNIQIYKKDFFWFCSGFLVYFGGTYFLFILDNYLIKEYSKRSFSYWYINLFLNILVNIIYTIAINMSRKPLLSRVPSSQIDKSNL